MEKHELKTVNPFFNDVWYGNKTSEIRKNDRDYQIGDLLILREYQEKIGYTNRRVLGNIGYILTDKEFPDGLQSGYCLLCLYDIRNEIYH